VRQAELTDAPLEIVSTWEWPVSYSGWETPLPPDYYPADEAKRQLERIGAGGFAPPLP
jgi:hypothetical protein